MTTSSEALLFKVAFDTVISAVFIVRFEAFIMPPSVVIIPLELSLVVFMVESLMVIVVLSLAVFSVVALPP